MRDEPDQQVAAEGGARSIGGGAGDPAGVLAPLQPEEVHAAPVVRIAGAQDASAAGLSRDGRVAGGHARTGAGTGPAVRAALHDATEGGRAVADRRAAGPATAGRHGGAFPRKKSRRLIEIVELAAADSTGMDTSRASRYFVRRRNSSSGCSSKTSQLVAYRTFPKLELVCDLCDAPDPVRVRHPRADDRPEQLPPA